MVKLRFFRSLAMALALCGWLPLTGQHSQAQGSKLTKSPKVVIVSLDAGADYLVDEFLARGVLPPDGAFARMSRAGVRAEAMLPINVASTSPAHIAMFTGAYPERTGIVANSFLLPGDPITRGSSGFTAPIKAETLWQAAMRQGKRVICSTAVAADNLTPERNCTLTAGYGRQELRAAVVQLAAASDEQWQLGETRFEHARPLHAAATSPAPLEYKFKTGSMPLYALAVDRSLDGRENFDAVLLDWDRDLRNGYIGIVRAGEWIPNGFTVAGQRVGSWIRGLSLPANAAQAAIYLGEVSSLPGAPESFIQDIETNVGFWPGSIDNPNLARGLISEAVWFEEVERNAEYIKRMVLHNFKQPNWDLLFAYLPVIDDVEHRFLLRDPRQADYDAEDGQRRARYARHVEWAYQQADRVLKEWMEAAPPETNFLIVSDHGMVPVHTTVMINNLLAQAGLKVEPEAQAEVRALNDGASAHIYVNLAGRQKDGIVAKEKLAEYVERIVAACQSLKDPLTNEPIFQTVLRRSELARLHLDDGERAGDVFVSARAGWSLSGRVLPGVPVLVTSTMNPDTRQRIAGNKATEDFLLAGGANEISPGVHGYTANHRQIQAIFLAYGPQVPARLTGLVEGVDVAPTAAALLGIAPPRDAQGKAVFVPLDAK